MILFARELDRANDKRGRVGNYTLKPKQSATNHQSAKSAIDRDTRRRRKKNVELHVAGSELMNYGLPFHCWDCMVGPYRLLYRCIVCNARMRPLCFNPPILHALMRSLINRHRIRKLLDFAWNMTLGLQMLQIHFSRRRARGGGGQGAQQTHSRTEVEELRWSDRRKNDALHAWMYWMSLTCRHLFRIKHVNKSASNSVCWLGIWPRDSCWSYNS